MQIIEVFLFFLQIAKPLHFVFFIPPQILKVSLQQNTTYCQYESFFHGERKDGVLAGGPGVPALDLGCRFAAPDWNVNRGS